MISKDRDLVAYSGQNALSSAGEAGKKVRFNKSLGDEKISFGSKPVNYARRAGGQSAYAHVRFLVAAVVDNYAAAFHDLAAELCGKFGGRGGTVKARCNEQRDLNIRISLAQLKQHVGDDIPARHRASVVGNDDNAVFLSARKLAQARTVYRPEHSAADYIASTAA